MDQAERKKHTMTFKELKDLINQFPDGNREVMTNVWSFQLIAEGTMTPVLYINEEHDPVIVTDKQFTPYRETVCPSMDGENSLKPLND